MDIEDSELPEYTLTEDGNEVVIVLEDNTVTRLPILETGWVDVSKEIDDEILGILEAEGYRYEKKGLMDWPIEVTQSYRRENAVHDALWQDKILSDPSELDLDEVATEIYVTFEVHKDGTVDITDMRAWPEP